MNQERKAKGLYWDKAWKLVEGCTKVSPGCDNCWSEQETVMRSNHNNEKIRTRAKAVVVPPGSNAESPAMLDDCGFDGRITMREDNLTLPLRTKKPTVFAIWNDLFHEDVPSRFISSAYKTMSGCPQHTFLVLTKRAERMGDFCVGTFGRPENESHIWHGVTVENQEQADARITHLLRVPGKRFISVEPMLGSISIGNEERCPECGSERAEEDYGPDPCGRICLDCKQEWFTDIKTYKHQWLHAVLCGGESGKSARPMHPDWVRSLRDQCEAAGVPFFFKQWGEWAPGSGWTMTRRERVCSVDWEGRVVEPATRENYPEGANSFQRWSLLHRSGKKNAGRLLDGKFHDNLPWDGRK